MYSPYTYIPSLLHKRHPVQLTFFVTNRCNAGCPFCFYLKNNNEVFDSNSNELQLEEIRKISASLGNLLWLAFSGGEIFLRQDLDQISETFYQTNHPVYMLYPTNGQNPRRIYHYIEAIAAKCPDSNVIVKLSIDGLYEQHDRLRNTPNSFSRTLKTYQRLSPLCEKYPNLELGVNTVFCSENQDEMDQIMEFVNTLKFIKTHTISLVRGNLKYSKYKQVDLNKYLKTISQLADKIRRKQTPHYKFVAGELKIAQDILQRKLIAQTMLQQRRVTNCYAGRANIVLSEYGEIYPCEMLQRSMGNVRSYDYDLSAILESAQAKSVTHTVARGNCYCSHECHMMTNILANPSLYFSLAKEYLKLKVA